MDNRNAATTDRVESTPVGYPFRFTLAGEIKRAKDREKASGKGRLLPPVELSLELICDNRQADLREKPFVTGYQGISPAIKGEELFGTIGAFRGKKPRELLTCPLWTSGNASGDS